MLAGLEGEGHRVGYEVQLTTVVNPSQQMVSMVVTCCKMLMHQFETVLPVQVPFKQQQEQQWTVLFYLLHPHCCTGLRLH